MSLAAAGTFGHTVIASTRVVVIVFFGFLATHVAFIATGIAITLTTFYVIGHRFSPPLLFLINIFGKIIVSF